jgi:hypothetical protein
MTGKLASGSGTSETFPAGRPTAIDDRTPAFRGHTGQKAELADTTLLGGLERSFHGRCSGWGMGSIRNGSFMTRGF